MGFDIVTLIKIFSITMSVMIIGSIVGVNMICQMDSIKLDDKCKSKILFVIERLVFSIFNSLVLGLALLAFLYYQQMALKIESHYFMMFLIAVLITSAMSFEITRKIVDVSRKWIDKKSKKVMDAEE